MLKQDLLSIRTALLRGSPVVIDVPNDMRYGLLRRYVEVSIRNGWFALMSFGATLFLVAYEAPLLPRVLGFVAAAALTLARWQIARDMEQRMDPADPRSDWRHDLLVAASMLLWGALPFVFDDIVSTANLVVIVYGTLIAMVVVSTSYIAALPACALAIATTALPLIAFLLLRHTYIEATMALGTVMLCVALQARLRLGHRTLLEALAAQRQNAALVKELEGFRHRLERENAALGDSLRDAAQAANHDLLTGLFNRRYLATLAPPLAMRVLEESEAVTIAIVDIDHFKRVNDLHGHLVGDDVLRAVAQLLGSRLREGDCLVRYGGEEFVIVLRRCDIRRGRRVAEALRHNVASSEMAHDDAPVTVSIGVAAWMPGESLDEVIDRADRMLYRAKQGGRDRVEADLQGHDALSDFYVSGGDSTLPGQVH